MENLNSYITSPIPIAPFPKQSEILFETVCDEHMVKILGNGIAVDMQYYKQNLPGAISNCYVRKTVAEKLYAAAEILSKANMGLLILDAYRPYEVQDYLYRKQLDALLQSSEFSGVPDDILHKKVQQFVSRPSTNIYQPFVHWTGGAVDLTIIDGFGKPIDMGSNFDDFTQVSHTAYYENTENKLARENRRLLFHVMISCGFTNIPTEWWHYDYGDNFWAFYNKKSAIYTGWENYEAKIKK